MQKFWVSWHLLLVLHGLATWHSSQCSHLIFESKTSWWAFSSPYPPSMRYLEDQLPWTEGGSYWEETGMQYSKMDERGSDLKESNREGGSKPTSWVWKGRVMDYRTEWRKTWLKVSITTERKASNRKIYIISLSVMFSVRGTVSRPFCIVYYRLEANLRWRWNKEILRKVTGYRKRVKKIRLKWVGEWDQNIYREWGKRKQW